MRTYSGHSTATASQRAVPHQPGQGADRPVDRLRPARPRPATTPTTRWPGARSARSACRSPTSATCADAARRHPARRDEHVDDDQRHRGVAARPVRRQRRGAGRARPRRCAAPRRTTSSRSTCRRGTYIFPPAPVAPADRRHGRLLRASTIPKWNPMNVCCVPPAGGRRDAGAGDRLRAGHRDRRARRRARLGPGRAEDGSRRWSASISFFVNAGIRFVEEICKMRAFTELWDRIGRERYGVTDAKARRFRYGVQVNSLGLTEAQPENNVQRIVLEMLGVTLSKDARARSLQLPAWNEALGLPRPWDQQWSLRMQQVLAFETDLLEYDDIFDGSHGDRGDDRRAGRGRARPSSTRCSTLGGAFEAIDELKGRLVRSHAERMRRIESGELTRRRRQPLHRDRAVAARAAARAHPHGRPGGRGRDRRRARRRGGPRATAPPSKRALDELRRAAASRREPHAGHDRPGPRRRHHRRVGRRAARGVRRVPRPDRRGRGGRRRRPAGGLRAVAERVQALPGGPPRLLVGQARPRRPLQRRRADRGRRPRRRHGGRLPGHPADARADRRVGPRRGRRRGRPVDPVGLAPRARARGRAAAPRAEGVDAPVVVGGIIPEDDRPAAARRRASPRVYTPKDFELGQDHGRHRRPRRRAPPRQQS